MQILFAFLDEVTQKINQIAELNTFQCLIGLVKV